jgi:hypothetical protein
VRSQVGQWRAQEEGANKRQIPTPIQQHNDSIVLLLASCALYALTKRPHC